jgi:hypothetical protein
MDDFNISILQGSKNEWCCHLVQIITPLIMDGYKSILNEAVALCKKNEEHEKYLMTFQNYISRIPKWNSNIVENECRRITEKSGCPYLEDLITCIHIIQLKMITAMRVGQKQKKIDINIPKLENFIHKIYINTARKLYKNIYLYEFGIPPLQAQKNIREIETLVECAILETVRESIPIEQFLKIYMDESIEEEVNEDVTEEIIDEPLESQVNIKNSNTSNNNESNNMNINTNSLKENTSIKFDDIDYIRDSDNSESEISAPKSIERLDKISDLRYKERQEEEEEDEESSEKIKFSDEPIILDNLDIHNLDELTVNVLPDLMIDDIEVLN